MNDPVRILLVEDNAADVYLFRKALQAAGLNFELTIIDNGGAALAFVRGEGEYAGRPVPDLAVLDVSLPKNDGIEVLEGIREEKHLANMPVIIMSSSPSPPTLLKHVRVARYIVKPVDLEEFLKIGQTLKEIVLHSQAERANS